MIPTDGFAQVELRSASELRDWLLANHTQTQSVWLVTWKKAPGAPFIPMDAILDELIAFGWVDGLRRKRDDGRTMQLVGPRRQQAWAQSYKQRAARLQDTGRMHPAGLRAIAQAKAAGLWDDTAQVDALVVPDDLAQALNAAPDAAAFFAAAAPSYRRNVLRWLHGAKRAQTRDARIARIAAACAQGQKLPQL